MNGSAFAVGERVRVIASRSIGHCRTPRYVRGATGVVEERLGAFRNPEDLAYGGPGTPPATLYWIRLRLTDVFERYAGAATDTLLVEVYEHWLAPAAAGDVPVRVADDDAGRDDANAH